MTIDQIVHLKTSARVKYGRRECLMLLRDKHLIQPQNSPSQQSDIFGGLPFGQIVTASSKLNNCGTFTTQNYSSL